MNNAILTKDNLIKRKWIGSSICYFCNEEESVSHLFFQCGMARAVWVVIAYSIGANNIPRSLQHAGLGVNDGCLLVKSFTLWVLQLYVGLFGEHETVCALKGKK